MSEIRIGWGEEYAWRVAGVHVGAGGNMLSH